MITPDYDIEFGSNDNLPMNTVASAAFAALLLTRFAEYARRMLHLKEINSDWLAGIVEPRSTQESV